MQNSTKEILSGLVEDQLTNLIREASCIQRHVKRARYHPSSNNEANPNTNSSINDEEDMTDTNTTKKYLVKRIDASDINLALQWRGCQTIYTTNAGTSANAVNLIPNISNENDKDTNIAANSNKTNKSKNNNDNTSSNQKSTLNDILDPISAIPTDRSMQRINLNTYVRSEMKTRPPSEIAISLHWLAVDGIQPSIPQNPLVPRGYAHHAHTVMNTSSNINRSHHPNSISSSLLSSDSQSLSNGRTAIVHRVEDDDEHGIGVSIRQLLPRLLPDELKYYFTNVAMKICAVSIGRSNGHLATSLKEQDEALANVTTDRGIQELVPFFSQFVNNQIRYNLKYVEHCRTMIRLMLALISNPHLTLEMHLNQLIVPVITCTVACHLGVQRNENHWALREESARTLVKIHKKYGSQYTNLSPRLLEVLCEAIGPDKPITTQYGGIVGLTYFGPTTIDAFLLPLTIPYWEKWEELLGGESSNEKNTGEKIEEKTGDEETKADGFARYEIQRCQQALLNALGIYMQYSFRNGHRTELDTKNFEEVFGERWIPLQSYQQYQTDYLMSFI